MSNKINLIQGDCLEEMQKLIDKSVKVDLILTDPPYGNIKGLTLRETANFRKEKTQWDNIIPIKPMFDCCYELLNDNRNLLLFCDGGFSFQLYENQYVSKLPYLYKYYWIKQNFANQMGVNVAPVNYIEEIFVFKRINGATENKLLREYAKDLWEYIGESRAEIDRRMGNFKVNHFFRFNGELKESKTNFFKLKKDEKYKSNILRYDKIYHGSLHPTQKPVDLLEDLICTYTDEGDLVLDFTMGSGSTGVACKNTNRDFIGIELEEEYFKIAYDRINDGQRRLV